MEDTDPKSSASAPVAVQYVFLFFLLEVLPQFFLLVFTLHILESTSYMLPSAREMIVSSSYMQVLFTFTLSNRMTYFITVILVMFYLVFLLIKSFGKLLIFPASRRTRAIRNAM